MPEPLVYLQAIAATAIVTTISVLVMATFRRQATSTWLQGICLAGTGLGLVAGVRVLSLQPAWPPASALDRMLLVVLPTTLAVELIGTCGWLSNRAAWCLRASLAAAIPVVLLYGSVYLNGGDADWGSRQVGIAMAVSSGLLLGTWTLLSILSTQNSGGSVTGALSVAILSGGLCVMLAGYIKGGAVALPLATAPAAAAASAWLLTHKSGLREQFTFWRKRNWLVGATQRRPNGVLRGHKSAKFAALRRWNATGVPAATGIGMGTVGLFSVLFVGRFFGRLTTVEALIVFLAPLLCWSTQVLRRRDQSPWLVGLMRLTLVGIPLAVVLYLAKQQFDTNFAPLL